MSISQAIILGAIQGLTEFLPISSSAHLVILRWLFGWEVQDLVFDVALHLGTLFALFAYFWREWYGMIRAYYRTTRIARTVGSMPSAPASQEMLIWPIIFACVPAGLAGLLLEKTAENHFRNPVLIGITLISLGIVLMVADRAGKKTRSMEAIRAMDWLIIGLAQALAIIPGVSRSGITITAGLFCGLQRDAAARFSFLLGAPVIFGAGIYELRKVFANGLPSNETLPFILGVLTATVVGYLCIGFLLGYLKTRSVGVFVLYRFLVGAGILVSYLLQSH